MVYVGANDGMLHGFQVCAPTDGVCSGTVSSDDGKELLAYVPGAVVSSHLATLAEESYDHRYFVDGAAKAGDAYIGGAWATILVGSAGAGARSVFALDVTDPDGFTASDVLWEFTDSNDADLGYTLPQASIVRLYDGHWGALVANGYNSTNGHAVLFILNLQTGAVLKKIDTGVAGNSIIAKNGLSTPVAVDVPRDVDGDGTVDAADKIVDYIYAGDLVGNVWKFDVTSASVAGWRLATGGAPLFVACTATTTPCSDANRQPITAKPLAIKATAAGQTGGLMILLGTGKFFEDGDNLVPADPQVQSLYGLWDNGAAIAGRSLLQAQTVVAELTAGSKELRVTSQNAVDYSTQKGWYMDLKTAAGTKQGERVVSAPMLDGKRIAFVTMMPISDPCSSGGTSWIMDLNAMTGAQAVRPVWDIAGAGGTSPDGSFDAYDKVSVSGVQKAPSGLKSSIGIVKTPAVVSIGGKKKWFFSGSSGGMATEEKGRDEESGRQTWVELH
jgi:type IV pilus assembly protein PilY1